MPDLPETLQPKGKPRSAMTAAALSLLFPGLGFVHASAWRPAAYYLGAYLIIGVLFALIGLSSILFTFTGFFIFTVAALLFEVLFRLYAAVMSYRLLSRLDPNPPAHTYGWRPYVMFLIIAIVGNLAIGQIPKSAAAYALEEPTMYPSLHTGDRFTATTRLDGLPARGDVVVFDVPGKNEPRDFAKRVIGLPGDRIRMDGTRPIVNGRALPRRFVREDVLRFARTLASPEKKDDATIIIFEEELPDGRTYRVAEETDRGAPDSSGEITIPEGTVFLLGDYRTVTEDSRTYGPVAVKNILGRALFVYWSGESRRIGQTLIPQR